MAAAIITHLCFLPPLSALGLHSCYLQCMWSTVQQQRPFFVSHWGTKAEPQKSSLDLRKFTGKRHDVSVSNNCNTASTFRNVHLMKVLLSLTRGITVTSAPTSFGHALHRFQPGSKIPDGRGPSKDHFLFGSSEGAHKPTSNSDRDEIGSSLLLPPPSSSIAAAAVIYQ